MTSMGLEPKGHLINIQGKKKEEQEPPIVTRAKAIHTSILYSRLPHRQ